MSDTLEVVDLIINTLKEHEANLDELSRRLSNAAGMMDRVMGHSLAQEKLDKLEEFVEFAKAGYEDRKKLGQHISHSDVLKDLNRILGAIRA